MLKQVLGIVGDQGWFDMSAPFEKTIYLSHGSAHSVALSRNGQPDTFVKFSEIASLAREAARCAQSFASYPGLAPTYVGHATRGQLEVLVTRAVDFRPLTGRLLRAGRDGASVRSGLEQYFRLMRESSHMTGPAASRHSWFDDLHRYFSQLGLPHAVAIELQRLGDALPTLPAMRQHGDLVLNNLGLRSDHRLVIFDWEDYGAIELPGLDLFTLQSSLQHEMAQLALPHAIQVSAQPLDLGRLCAAMGLSQEMYARFATAYALAFRYLKRNYSPEVRARADSLINATVAGFP